MAKLKVKFKKLDENAVIPKPAKEDDVGFDLYAPIPCEGTLNEFTKLLLLPGVTKVSTRIAFADYFESTKRRSGKLYAKIEGRSGLASKGIFPVGGIVDLGYRGDITVCLANITGEPYALDLTNAIAQFVIYNIENDVEFEEVDEIEETERGDAGFGSTDKQ